VDDVGVLSRDPYVLLQVVKVLLQQPELEWVPPTQVLVADDCFGLSTISSIRTADLLSRAVSETLGRRLITHNS
jgi:amidase